MATYYCAYCDAKLRITFPARHELKRHLLERHFAEIGKLAKQCNQSLEKTADERAAACSRDD